MILGNVRLTGALVATLALVLSVLFGPVAGGNAANAADEVELTISIKDHKFEPAELKAPAGKAIKLTVNNLDASAEEFESHSLKVEKVIAGKGTAVIRIRPQAKGSFKFFGEYHEKTAQGVLIIE
jgi:plastocyanin